MNIYLYVLDTLADWEIACITAELNSGRYLDRSKEKPLFIKIADSLAPVTTMGGITLVPDKSIDEVEFSEGDLLILPGADTWMSDNSPAIVNRLEELIEKKVTVAAICGATTALAQKGLLNNRKHTSNDKEVLKMFCPNYSGSKFYVSDPAVTDDNLITASGLAPLEFSYEVFKKAGVMKEQTLEAWYGLFKTRDGKYFSMLMESLE